MRDETGRFRRGTSNCETAVCIIMRWSVARDVPSLELTQRQCVRMDEQALAVHPSLVHHHKSVQNSEDEKAEADVPWELRDCPQLAAISQISPMQPWCSVQPCATLRIIARRAQSFSLPYRPPSRAGRTAPVGHQAKNTVVAKQRSYDESAR